MKERFELRPIGVVRSPVADTHAMPVNGVPAAVEVYEEFAPALAQLESNTHIWVIAWLDRADRDCLQAAGRHGRPGGNERGVFSLRHASRPNPLGLTPARLLGVDGRQVRLDRLDFVDGTPVVDLKRYSPGWDAIFAARTYYETLPRGDERPEQLAEDFFLDAVRFHGEECVGAALAARMMVHVVRAWNVAVRDPALRVDVGRDGCLADGLQAITGATLGSGRLQVHDDVSVRFTHGWQHLRLRPRSQLPLRPEEVLQAPESALFGIHEQRATDMV
ncbi:MAG TPA: tRNA (N6-threonylcarbamoyladenosine(37)-N6)-methyltransferase TrmO [Chloroflexota bacterium]|nr:tRNA (N6-threonylcarbamoyladenosine(37)-N6)-methyltransferase TrmO [Chloroflexota bacterium]